MPARHLEDAVGELGGGQGAAPAARAARCAGQAGQLVQAALAAVLQQQGGVELLRVHQVRRLPHQPVRQLVRGVKPTIGKGRRRAPAGLAMA